MKNITIYTKNNCAHCESAKTLLQNKGLRYQEIDVSHDDNKLIEMVTRSKQRTVPQIFIGDNHIGGNIDLHNYLNNTSRLAS